MGNPVDAFPVGAWDLLLKAMQALVMVKNVEAGPLIQTDLSRLVKLGTVKHNMHFSIAKQKARAVPDVFAGEGLSGLGRLWYGSF